MNKKPIFGSAFTLFEFVQSSDNAGSSPRQGEQDVNSRKKDVIFTVSSAVKILRECSELRAVFGTLRLGLLHIPHIILYAHNVVKKKIAHAK